jgi:hypothetical protein
MKICTKCGLEKELIGFYKSSRNKSGYRSQCISCDKEYNELNKVRIKEYFKNRPYDAEKSEIYYNTNKEIILSKRKEYYSNNKECKLEYQKEYQKLNKEKRNLYLFEKRKNDPQFRLITNVRNLIYNSFYYNGYSKNSKTGDLLGCSFDELKQHLESKFEPWMNWNNRGLYNGDFNYGWDIDHIIPLSSANKEDDIIRLNHYTNLQPLCSKINRDVKKNKIEHGTK